VDQTQATRGRQVSNPSARPAAAAVIAVIKITTITNR